ncbi:MAG: NAD(P)-dependent oxidoreductase [Thermoplasmataceae archaeon]
METVGFIGLGKMGQAISRNIMKKYGLKAVYNRSAEKAEWFGKNGVEVCSSPKEVAAKCSVVFAMLTDTEAVRSVVTGKDGILEGIRKGSVLVDLSTIYPDDSKEMAEMVLEKESEMLDSPVIGSVDLATAGTLTIAAGGSETGFRRVEPILATFGKRIVHVGANGLGLKVKALNNMIMGTNYAVLCEAISMGEKIGIRTETLEDIFSGGGANSRALELKGKRMIEKNYDPQFILSHQLKDIKYGLRMAMDLFSPAPVTAAACTMYEQGYNEGMGDLDYSALIETYRRVNRKA